ncbi:MAG: bifunctional diaminohydroxyphosphoribosylaminopyrimidine deaminase/5-amino-6-(5-phosphoribosylamino)uracil reductase RibD [Salinivirgaceae bacterium]|nr:MAG: bifunctional diaminohydroxyphosphoribosylaminopyrimidine deaminase/5-amino-6-(5-phosphoribosylamino)uracil reductase RibD [Salinivirgaceae bacterium]
MRRCLQLAQNGMGHTAPNPMVGCVITHNNKIIGEGYHHQYGEAHAEVNAIASVKDQSLLEKSTLYVNLEPCAHYGKTPPCSDLIIEKRIPQIIIGNVDPYAKVAGKGIEKLEKANRKVKYGLLEKEAWYLNRRFFTFHTKKRPWVILKWAESEDGFIDIIRNIKSKGTPAWLTNEQSKHLVHKWRAEEQSILVGQRTAILDNPNLNVREWYGADPLRILIDPDLSVQSPSSLLDTNQLTLVFNYEKSDKKENLEYIQVAPDESIIAQVMDILHERDIQSIIVEGGAFVLNAFIKEGFWDEARRFIGTIYLENGVAAPKIPGKPYYSKMIDETKLHYYFRDQALNPTI